MKLIGFVVNVAARDVNIVMRLDGNLKMIRSTILNADYSSLFPHQTFPWRLEVNKDHHNVKGIALTVCHFECEEHLTKVHRPI